MKMNKTVQPAIRCPLCEKVFTSQMDYEYHVYLEEHRI